MGGPVGGGALGGGVDGGGALGGGHTAAVNGVVWAPHSACHICTVGDDYQALIWDLSSLPKAVEDPILAYTAEAEISNVAWSASLCDWVNIAYGNKLQVLRV